LRKDKEEKGTGREWGMVEEERIGEVKSEKVRTGEEGRTEQKREQTKIIEVLGTRL
jgi:uncharacterized Fe-S cluster-containing protein